MADILKLKESNCRNCHKCVRNCPVKSIRFTGGQAQIVPEECVLCGQCVVTCPQNAKEIRSAREQVRAMLAAGGSVVASVDSSFIAAFGGISAHTMEKALKDLGFSAAEETARGAVAVREAYRRVMESGQQDVLISSACPSVNLLIRKHFPTLVSYLMPVVTPMEAHALQIRQRDPGARVVYIGPCIAAKDVVQRFPGTVDAVLTFEELAEWMQDDGVSFEKTPDLPEGADADMPYAPESETDEARVGRTRLFSLSGGIIRCLEPGEGYTCMAIDGISACRAALRELERGRVHGAFLEMCACPGGCIGGPARPALFHDAVRGHLQISAAAGPEDFDTEPLEHEQLARLQEPIRLDTALPPPDEVRRIMGLMGKTKAEDILNCGTCGYNSCRDKAIAIWQGKAEISMCLPFLMERSESLSDILTDNVSNGILVLNEDFEILRINEPAMQLFGIEDAAAVVGSPVVRLMDPKDFMMVRTAGRPIRRKQVWLSEYGLWVEETIVHDRPYRRFLCILRDVTAQKEAGEHREAVIRQAEEMADRVVDQQMRIVQEIASLLGETAAETKIALTKLKGVVRDE